MRLLLAHPFAELVTVTSRQYSGKTLAEIFPRFSHDANAKALKFSEPHSDLGANVVFLALPHGVASEFAVPLIKAGSRVIDLSADFRLKNDATYLEFYGQHHPAPDLLNDAVYGMPEINRNALVDARLVACPGCYPTSILLPTLPLIRERLVNPRTIIANSLSGVTGAGRKVEVDYLFAECNESLRPYGVPKHRHLSEIEAEISAVAGETCIVQFTPHLVPVSRGILTTMYFDAVANGAGFSEKVASAFENAYRTEPFVRLLSGAALPDTKNVVGRNFIDIAWRIDPRTGRVIVMSAIDNIVKGTSGQAVQCFNIMCGYAENAGLL